MRSLVPIVKICTFHRILLALSNVGLILASSCILHTSPPPFQLSALYQYTSLSYFVVTEAQGHKRYWYTVCQDWSWSLWLTAISIHCAFYRLCLASVFSGLSGWLLVSGSCVCVEDDGIHSPTFPQQLSCSFPQTSPSPYVFSCIHCILVSVVFFSFSTMVPCTHLGNTRLDNRINWIGY